ncbi:MAG: hypothetical protein ACYCO9_01980 [Streptosporangiaceae bacterium]
MNLAAAYGAPAAEGGYLDADRCAELLLSAAGEAGTSSPEHAAIARTNLAGLRAGQGRWEEAARHYGQARQSRHAMIEQSAVRAARLGEVIAPAAHRRPPQPDLARPSEAASPTLIHASFMNQW